MYNLSKSLVVKPTDGGGVCLNLETGDYMRCNQTAFDVLTYLKGRPTGLQFDESSVADYLSNACGADQQTAAEDARALIEMFGSTGLIND